MLLPGMLVSLSLRRDRQLALAAHAHLEQVDRVVDNCPEWLSGRVVSVGERLLVQLDRSIHGLAYAWVSFCTIDGAWELARS
jgi:hypothetical protein